MGKNGINLANLVAGAMSGSKSIGGSRKGNADAGDNMHGGQHQAGQEVSAPLMSGAADAPPEHGLGAEHQPMHEKLEGVLCPGCHAKVKQMEQGGPSHLSGE